MIVAGPYARRGVSHAHLDNTSILQLIAERFGAPGESYSPEVLARSQQGIASLSTVLDAAANNTQIATPANRNVAPVPEAAHTGSGLEAAFEAALRDLASRHRTEALIKYPELRALVRAA